MIVALIAIGFLAVGYWVFMSSYSQLFGTYPYCAKITKKVVALTFDDGPNEPYTTSLMNFLNQRGIKATFFQVGQCVQRYPQVSRQLAEHGHVIGNHSLSHAFHKYFIHPGFQREIEQTQIIIEKTIGKKPALYRSPWLWRQPWLLCSVRKAGLRPVSGVFCHSLEVLQIDAQRIAKAAIKHAKPGTIIIFHDGFDARGGNRTQTVEAVKIVVDELQTRGYSFVTVDKLLGIPAYQKK